MKFETLLEITRYDPIFESGLLMNGDVNPCDVRRQLTRWQQAGKIHQLRRGVYLLAAPWRKTQPHPFAIANRIQPASYVSLQSALAWYGMIPEYVPMTTSITTQRPETITNHMGSFSYQHMQASLFHGFQQAELGNKQQAYLATPEKALQDFIYLQPDGDTEACLREMRLQALEKLNLDTFALLAEQAGKPKLLRSVKVIEALAHEEAEAFEWLD